MEGKEPGGREQFSGLPPFQKPVLLQPYKNLIFVGGGTDVS